MCVNDVICSGAKPLYFLDYISTKSLDDNVSDIVYGVNIGCVMAGMELLGGETAEHFRATDYDLAGFCTGIVEKNEIVDGSNIRPGDVVIGIESSGLHSNGYTLVNDMLWRQKLYLLQGDARTVGANHHLCPSHSAPVGRSSYPRNGTHYWRRTA